MRTQPAAPTSGGNDPAAPRMAAIAIISQNLVIGPTFGTFGVLLGPVAQRLDVPVEQAAFGISLVFISSAVLSGPIGALLARYSLRWMMTIGALSAALAFTLLGLTSSYVFYLGAYALLLGPAKALCGTVGPATLVTRWFRSGGGLVQGLVYLPLMVAAMPLVANAMLKAYGISATYLVIAATIAVVLVPLLMLVVDAPPLKKAAAMPTGAEPVVRAGMTAREFLAQPTFWALALAAASITCGASALSATLVPMARAWDIDSNNAAVLITVMSGVGMAGSVLFGWIADKLGGARGLAILTLNSAILWFVLAQPLPYPALIVVIGLHGLCASGAVTNLSRAVAETFGTASFSRGFGLAMTLGLPLHVTVIPLFPWIAGQTGSYVPAMLGSTVLLGVAFLLSLYAVRRSGPRLNRVAIA